MFKTMVNKASNKFESPSHCDILTPPHKSQVPQMGSITKMKIDFEVVSPRRATYSMTTKLLCSCKSSQYSYCCQTSYEWLLLTNPDKSTSLEHSKNRALYLNLVNSESVIVCDYQIQKDVSRTFPTSDCFKSKT